MKPTAAPKKETARIQVPTGKAAPPQATIKMQQTQPLAQAPAIRPAAAHAPAGAPAVAVESEGADQMTNILSWVVLAASAVAAAAAWMAFSA
jgi:hypothetical protein